MLRAMTRRSSRWVAHRICLTACAALLGACGSSSGQSSTSSGHSSTSSGSTTASTPSTTASTPTAPPGKVVCGPAGQRTLAADRRARLFVSGSHVFGCARGGATPYDLGRATTCLGGALVGPFALSGVRVAFALKTCGVDTGRSAVLVRRLDTGKLLAQRPATTSGLGAESYVTVSAIVLGRSGSYAWITEAASIVSHRRAVQVQAAGPGGARILDAGAAIRPRSLRLSGTVLRWRYGGQIRSARLG
jgi:hypothetical protein